MWAGTHWAMAVLRVWSFLLSISINKTSSFPTPGDIMYLTNSYSAKTGIKQSPWDPSIAVSGKGQEERAQVAVYKWLLLWLNFNQIGQAPLLDNSQWLSSKKLYCFLELGCLYWAKSFCCCCCCCLERIYFTMTVLIYSRFQGKHLFSQVLFSLCCLVVFPSGKHRFVYKINFLDLSLRNIWLPCVTSFA